MFFIISVGWVIGFIFFAIGIYGIPPFSLQRRSRRIVGREEACPHYMAGGCEVSRQSPVWRGHPQSHLDSDCSPLCAIVSETDDILIMYLAHVFIDCA